MSWKNNLTVVLVEPRNPLNIGAAARAMLNFGFRRLALVTPYDVAFREARSAVGASEVLAEAQVTKTVAEAVAGCSLVVGTASPEGRVFRQPRRPLPEGSRLLRTHLTRGRAALLFGSEKFGLSNQHLSHCQWVLRIPTDPECPSMNLGQAVALCCYDLAREARRGAAQEKTREGRSGPTKDRTRATAPAELQEKIFERLLALLETSGYVQARTRRSHVLKLRRLVGRLALSPPDAQVLLGMLRQIEWKLGQPGYRGSTSPPSRDSAPSSTSKRTA